jgi:hypothetical protein
MYYIEHRLYKIFECDYRFLLINIVYYSIFELMIVNVTSQIFYEFEVF